MMRRMVAGLLVMGFAVQTYAVDKPIISCMVTHSIACVDDSCQRTPEEYAHIDLLMDIRTGDGNLCTSTYCRAFTWLPVMGDRSERRTFGPILSTASGSTEDKINDPTVDYHLWISSDRATFSLLPLGGYGATWSGECEMRARG